MHPLQLHFKLTFRPEYNPFNDCNFLFIYTGPKTKKYIDEDVTKRNSSMAVIEIMNFLFSMPVVL